MPRRSYFILGAAIAATAAALMRIRVDLGDLETRVDAILADVDAIARLQDTQAADEELVDTRLHDLEVDRSLPFDNDARREAVARIGARARQSAAVRRGTS